MNRVLVISGSDSSGGAGMQADCAAVRSIGVFPLCAVSCITIQNSKGLRALQCADPAIFRGQIEAALEDFTPDAIKIGMIPNRCQADIILEFLEVLNLPNVVLDPILAPSTGSHQLLQNVWLDKDLLKNIAPYITLITPNLPEGRLISGCSSDANASEIAQSLIKNCGFRNVLVKGGHADKEYILTDHLFDESGNDYLFSNPKVATRNTHGTGCALSSLIAAILAKGAPLPESIENASKILNFSLRKNSSTHFYDNLNVTNGPAFFL